MFKINKRPASSYMSFEDDSASKFETHRQPPGYDRFDLDVEMEDDLGEGSSRGRNTVSPGEVITSSREYMRGHGTYVEDEQVISSVSGTIERVNKLISVRALKQRYTPEVGDLVIGRIVEVGSMRWKVDANARQDAVLMLSSVNLPGGVQRRKIESDALKMREFLAEGDLLVAEVQAFFADGAMSLHTRSLKYGKLRNGQLLSLPPRLIRRLKSHFHHLPPPCGPKGVDIILGLNGYVWVSSGTSVERKEGGEGFDAEAVYSNKNDDIEPQGRKAISTVANIMSILADHDIPLTDTLISSAYDWLSNQRMETEEHDNQADASVSSDLAERMVEEVAGIILRGAA